jgi:hypothetical protein
MTDPGERDLPSSYVVLAGASLEWAIDAELVREIILEHEWRGASPFDVAALWKDTPPDDGTPARVIVVLTRHGLRGIRATRISYRSFREREVSRLPAIMAHVPAAAFVTGLLFDDPRPALVVLNPEGLSYES